MVSREIWTWARTLYTKPHPCIHFRHESYWNLLPQSADNIPAALKYPIMCTTWAMQGPREKKKKKNQTTHTKKKHALHSPLKAAYEQQETCYEHLSSPSKHGPPPLLEN